jgi:hypothetical protein
MSDAEAMDVDGGEQRAIQEAKSVKAPAKRFEIKKWNAVAMWSWAICTDTCAICRNNLYEPSIDYQANPTGRLGLAGNALGSLITHDIIPLLVLVLMRPCMSSGAIIRTYDC